MSSGLFSATQIASSGLSAQRLRMEVAAANIANAETTRTPEGGPYRRQQAVFSTVLNGALSRPESADALAGVEVSEVVSDAAELPRVYLPGHPDADAEGFVTFPNVQVSHEMVELMTAARAYEANLKSLQVFKSMAEQSLALLRGS